MLGGARCGTSWATLTSSGYAPVMDWTPFTICAPGERPPRPRAFRLSEGLGDRMRTAAFAELQAVRAFTWAVERFDDVPPGLLAAWRRQIPEEQQHMTLILDRMAELGVAVDEVPVAPRIWESIEDCTSGEQFCVYMASAEERGRRAGLLLIRALEGTDPETARVFQQIVDDERAHVALADTYFGWRPT